MKKKITSQKESLVLKKQKVLGLKAANYGQDPTDTTHGTTRTTATTGDLDAIMIAYITM